MLGSMIVFAAFNTFAADVQSSTDKCISETVYLKEVLSGEKYDALLTPYLNQIEGYRHVLEMEVANPYRCSLK